jgi:thiol-disulfide isomerase/thioredoxin
MRKADGLLLGAIILGCSLRADAVEDKAIILEDVFRAWEARTVHAKTLRYEWSETTKQATASLPQDHSFNSVFVKKQSFDTKFVDHALQHSFQLGPLGVWHRRTGITWHPPTCQFLNQSCWTYFENPTNISVYEYLEPEKTQLLPERSPILAFIHEGEADERWGNAIPILLHHRALDEQLSLLKRESLKLTTDQEFIQGHRCVRLMDGSRSYWVDKDSFLIRRWEYSWGKLLSRSDIDYKQDSSGNFIVDGWTQSMTHSQTGKLRETSHVKITAFEINGRVESKEKLAAIPVGTHVIVSKEQDRIEYIVRPGDQKRAITEDDRKFGTLTYQELLSSETGKGYPEEFVALYQRLGPIRDMDATNRDEALVEFKAYLLSHKLLMRDWELVQLTTARLFASKDPQSVIRLCRDLASSFDNLKPVLLQQSRELEGELRYKALLGSEMVITGTTVDGSPFDWAKYRGKVVLVNFWSTGCKGCVEEMPLLMKLHRKYRDAGFDIVGISSDSDEKQLKEFLQERKIAWMTIRDSGEDSNAGRYNIRSFPTSIVVSRDGKVVSPNAIADQLEEIVKKTLDTK